MKKSLFIALLIGFFSLTGKAQSVQMKSYQFEYPSLPANTYWYQDVNLYVNGALYDSFRIGNRIDMPVNVGFAVPVGSTWRLWVTRSEATKNGMACMSPVEISVTSGTATNAQRETIPLIRTW